MPAANRLLLVPRLLRPFYCRNPNAPRRAVADAGGAEQLVPAGPPRWLQLIKPPGAGLPAACLLACAGRRESARLSTLHSVGRVCFGQGVAACPSFSRSLLSLARAFSFSRPRYHRRCCTTRTATWRTWRTTRRRRGAPWRPPSTTWASSRRAAPGRASGEGRGEVGAGRAGRRGRGVLFPIAPAWPDRVLAACVARMQHARGVRAASHKPC